MKKLPDAIYIGLQKTGSTFLRHYLWNHDEVYCDRNGIFFQTDGADIERRGIDAVRQDYQALFPDRPVRKCHVDMYEALGMGYVLRGVDKWDSKIFIQPDYSLLNGPASVEPETVAARIHAVVPAAKIVITIRSQVAWLDSNYRHYFSLLPRERCRFSDFLATLEGKISLDAGHFDRTVNLYDRLFGAHNVFVLPLEAVEKNQATSLRALAKFLDIKSSSFVAEPKYLNRGPVMSSNQGRKLLRMLGRKSSFGISRAEAGTLEKVYAAGNIRLSNRIDIDLKAMGYPV